jgi:hypothetical protein
MIYPFNDVALYDSKVVTTPHFGNAAYDIMRPMTDQQEHNTRVVQMFMGTRADHAPHPLPYPVFAWQCEQCKAKTYSVAKPPPDHTLVCNVCVSEMTAKAEQDASTHFMWNMTDELEDSVRSIAGEQKRPAEEVFNHFLDWKLGRPTKAVLSTKPEKK